jgi:hypothetical protein
MTDAVRVYVAGRAVEVTPGATMLDAVRAFDDETARLVAAGDRALRDSRGLPLSPASPVFAGAIVRVVSGRGSAGRA